MLLLAAFSLLGFFRLARSVSNSTVATAAALLTAAYPVFFAQSSLAQVDLPAAGLIFWALDSYFRRRWTTAVTWFSLAALAKETAILIPIALLLLELICLAVSYVRSFSADGIATREGTASSRAVSESKSDSTARLEAVPSRNRNEATGFFHDRLQPDSRAQISITLLLPILPLALWYVYHYSRTGFVFGNPEFFRYNVQGTLHPLRILLAALLRLWQAVGYMNLFVLTIACAIAMRHSPKDDVVGQRQRIEVFTQLTFLAIAIFYGGALSVIGGAVLARYMLPVVPLVILVCVSTIWRRLKLWPAMIVFVVLAFVQSLFVNPPYGFAPEDNLAYRDYIHLHQQADAFLVTRYPNARVLTAWPASGELTQSYLGYVEHPLPVAQIVQIEDFTAESLLSAEPKAPDGRSEGRSRFDVALVFSTKYQPPPNLFDRWQLWQQWKARYFGFHRDLTPEAAASLLGGKLVYVEYWRGQWVGIVQVSQRGEDAQAKRPHFVVPCES
jgi:hypothetical protein